MQEILISAAGDAMAIAYIERCNETYIDDDGVVVNSEFFMVRWRYLRDGDLWEISLETALEEMDERQPYRGELCLA